MADNRIVCLVYADADGRMAVIDAANVTYVLDRIAALHAMEVCEVLYEMIENQEEEA